MSVMRKGKNNYSKLSQEALDELYATPGFPNSLKGKLEQLIQQALPTHTFEYTSMLVPKAYHILKPDAKQNDLRNAAKLGWCYEIYQAYDFVVHESSSGEVDTDLWSDFSMLEWLTNLLLRKHFSALGPVYYQIVNLFLECGFEACKAHRVEALQTVKNLKKGIIPLESFTMEMYRALANLKGAPIHFYLPIALAMTLAGENAWEQRETFEKVKNLSLNLGTFFQCMEDYFDAFSKDPVSCEETKDLDIREGLFSWVFFEAKENCCSEHDWEILKENYGHDNDISVANVKAIYEKINVPQLFGKFKAQEYKLITDEIERTLVAREEKNGKVLKSCLLQMLEVFATV